MASHGDNHGHHLIPWRVYFIVFGALIFLTVMTYLTAEYVDLGPLNVPLALAIACTKGALVVLFFMALKYDTPVNAVVFIVGALFVLVFLGVTLLDTTYRGQFDSVKAVTIMDQDIANKALMERDSVVQTLLTGMPTAQASVAIATDDATDAAASTDTTGTDTADDAASSGDAAALIAQGEELYTSKVCMSCHSLDGTQVIGPTFKGLFGKQETMTDGTTITVDEAYLRESITNPAEKIVEGFMNMMPPMPMADEEVDALVAFIKHQQ